MVIDAVVSRKVHPQLLPSYQELAVDQDKRIAILSLTQGISKPYVLRHNSRENIYVRVGGAARLASREQQARLFESGGILHTETLPVSGTSFESLDLERIKDYLNNILRDPEIPSSDQQWIRRLLDLGLLTDSALESAVCSIAGLLVFGHKPRRYLKQASG